MSLTLLASNNASTVLASSINASATTLTVNTGAGSLFPSPVAGTSFFKLTLIDAATGQLTEIVHVTARTGDVMTIERAQEGTAARVWSANDIVANMMTAGTLSYILGSFQPLDATLTALAALIGAADKLPYFNGADTAALTDLTAVGRNIIGKSSIAEVLTYLGLGGLPDTFGSAASADVGTGSNQLPNTSQADTRYKLKKWVSPGQTMVSNTPTIVNHGLTIDPDLCSLSIRLKCLVANNGYAVGDYAVGFGPRYPSTSTGIAPGSLGAILTSTYVQYNSGQSGDLVTLKSTGGNTSVDYSQWALEFRILYQ